MPHRSATAPHAQEITLDQALTALRHARVAADADAAKRPLLVDALETLATLQKEAGDFGKTEALYIEAIETAEKCAGAPVQIPRLRMSLATLYDFNQREEKAVPLYEKAIEGYESLDPPQKEVTAQLRNNLAMIYKSIKKYALAEQHYLVALEILEDLHGRNDARVAALYNNIGGLYYAAGHPEQAKEMHGDALEIRLKVFGAEHPEVAQSYSNLATACYALENDTGSVENYEKCLRILEKNLDTSAASYEHTAEDYISLLASIGEEKKAGIMRKRLAKVIEKHRAN